eukprot:6186966-Pleurochrysis_carterae.AAC.1
MSGWVGRIADSGAMRAPSEGEEGGEEGGEGRGWAWRGVGKVVAGPGLGWDGLPIPPAAIES